MVLAGLLATAVLGHAASVATATPTPREWHVALCVAALEANAESLAGAARGGQEQAAAVLLSRLESAAAFVGDNYLHGDGDEAAAHALLDEAREATRQRLSAAQLTVRQEACAAEGSQMLDAANAFQRAVVKRVAKRRMNKLLGS